MLGFCGLLLLWNEWGEASAQLDPLKSNDGAQILGAFHLFQLIGVRKQKKKRKRGAEKCIATLCSYMCLAMDPFIYAVKMFQICSKYRCISQTDIPVYRFNVVKQILMPYILTHFAWDSLPWNSPRGPRATL